MLSMYKNLKDDAIETTVIILKKFENKTCFEAS